MVVCIVECTHTWWLLLLQNDVGLKRVGGMDECDSAEVGWRRDYYVNYKHCLATFLVIVMAC